MEMGFHPTLVSKLIFRFFVGIMHYMLSPYITIAMPREDDFLRNYLGQTRKHQS
jgi:hypothetical protein